jgi:hypothetical protein
MVINISTKKATVYEDRKLEIKSYIANLLSETKKKKHSSTQNLKIA